MQERAAWEAVGDWYHAWFTGTVLMAVSRQGPAEAAELMFRVFRRQQQQTFLAGLVKLGIDGLPPAVAAARYHYLSNFIGGVSVEYVEESIAQGLGALSAAALGVAGGDDLRHSVRGECRHAARLARQQRGDARQARPRLRLHRADGGWRSGARRLLHRARPRPRRG